MTSEKDAPKTVQLSENTFSMRHDRHSQFVALKVLEHNLLPSQNDAIFQANVQKAETAIARGIHPTLIPDGSSGSYFVRDEDEHVIAVFKPKDEEPFAKLNPKWPKYFQRILCFCCFGRACLIPNHGFLSETGASLVDDRLGLDIVPKTRVVRLTSKAFSYGRRCGCFKRKTRPKEGSYQLFMHGYQSANALLASWKVTPPSADETDKFVGLFQRLMALDYIIRNTDRHLDNWLIRYTAGEELVLAAIDNGLAFPVKHPEEASRLRTFPYGWASLRDWTELPWQDDLRQALLDKLNSTRFVHTLCEELKLLFRHDHTHSALLVHGQMRVLRGQMWNLREALTLGEAPSTLLLRPLVVVERRYGRHSLPPDDWKDAFRVKDAQPLRRFCL